MSRSLIEELEQRPTSKTSVEYLERMRYMKSMYTDLPMSVLRKRVLGDLYGKFN